MAIETTRGLPSFSEMYQAYKNRGNIGQALEAGVTGYLEGKASTAGTKNKVAEANKYNAEAESLRNKISNPTSGMFDVRALEGKLPPDQYELLLKTASPVSLTDPGRYISNAEAGQYIRLLGQEAATNSANAGHALTEQGQELSAASKGVDINKGPEPTAFEVGRTALGEGIQKSSGSVASIPIIGGLAAKGFDLIGGLMKASSVEKQRARAPFVAKITDIAKVKGAKSPEAAANKAAIASSIPTPTESKERIRRLDKAAQYSSIDKALALEELKNAGLPATDANIEEALRQLKGNK